MQLLQLPESLLFNCLQVTQTLHRCGLSLSAKLSPKVDCSLTTSSDVHCILACFSIL